MTNTVISKQAARILMLSCVILFSILPVNGQTWQRRRGSSQRADDYHFGYISGSVGYSMLQTQITGAMPKGSLGGSVGIGYEFRNSGFWANVGAQMSFHRSTLTIDEYSRNYPGRDTQGKEVTLIYRINQTDELQWNYVDVPILVGYYIRGFHVGSGVKISYALNPQTRSFGIYNVSGKYENYPDPFVNMPDRGYKDYEYNNLNVNQLNVGASIIGEIGYDLLSSVPTSSRFCNVLKLAFYIEYGLNNQLRSWDVPQEPIQPRNTGSAYVPIDQVSINPHVNTFAKPARTVPFFTGVKLTYMIGGSRTARVGGIHHGCMCYN